MTRDPNKSVNYNIPYERIALLDAETAVDLFGDSEGLLLELESRVEALAEEWNEKNGDASSRGKRVRKVFVHFFIV